MTVSWSCSGVDVKSGGLNMKGDSRVNFLLLLITLSDAYVNRSTFKLKIWWVFLYIYIPPPGRLWFCKHCLSACLFGCQGNNSKMMNGFQ